MLLALTTAALSTLNMVSMPGTVLEENMILSFFIYGGE